MPDDGAQKANVAGWGREIVTMGLRHVGYGAGDDTPLNAVHAGGDIARSRRD